MLLDPELSDTRDGNEDDQVRERPLNPYRKLQGPDNTGLLLLQEVTDKVEAFEKASGMRSRTRGLDAKQSFDAAVQALLCDLLVNAMSEDCRGIHLSRSHRVLGRKTKYDHPANTRQLVAIMDAFASEDLSLATMEPGGETEGGQRQQTVLTPTVELLELAESHGVRREHIVSRQPWEPIVLKRSKGDFWDRGEAIEYEDTKETEQLRSNLSLVNEWLGAADLGVMTRQHADTGPEDYIDLSDRYLRRIFTQESFQSGGRLYGGFWLPMKKADRFDRLTIDGERVVEVDYGQIMPRLAYSIQGAVPRTTDLYAIPGIETCHREGIKTFMSAMLFNWAPITQKPKGTADMLPGSKSAKDIERAIKAAHPAIASQFAKGVGHRCQYLESQILMDVLLRLMMDHDITALPIHDAVLVPASAAGITQEVMLDVFREHAGFDGDVEVNDGRDQHHDHATPPAGGECCPSGVSPQIAL